MEFGNRNHWRGMLVIVQVIIGTLSAASIFYALYFHHNNAAYYGQWGALAIMTLSVSLVWGRSWANGDSPALGDVISAALGGSMLGFLLVALYYCFSISLYDAYVFFTSPRFSTATSVAVVGATTLVLGIILFIFRLKWRCLYGVSEALAGVAVASQRFYSDALAATSQTSPTFIVLAILTAGVYLVVRGADNIHQGLTKPPLDPYGQRLALWLDKVGQNKAWRSYWLVTPESNGPIEPPAEKKEK